MAPRSWHADGGSAQLDCCQRRRSRRAGLPACLLTVRGFARMATAPAAACSIVTQSRTPARRAGLQGVPHCVRLQLVQDCSRCGRCCRRHLPCLSVADALRWRAAGRRFLHQAPRHLLALCTRQAWRATASPVDTRSRQVSNEMRTSTRLLDRAPALMPRATAQISDPCAPAMRSCCLLSRL